LSGLERREDPASALFGRLRTGVAGQVVLDTGVDHVDLRPRFTCDPVPSCPLSFFEDGEWRENADEEPLEAGELAPPPVEPTAIDEDVVHEHVVPAARARRDRRTHPGGKLLADGAGNDRRVVPPEEPFRSARTVLHPPLVDRAPERIDPEPEPRLVRERLDGTRDGRLPRARRAVEKDDASLHAARLSRPITRRLGRSRP